MVLYDTSGRRRLEVALKSDGATGLGLYDETGEGRAELVVSGSGAPSLSLYGPNGKRLAKLPTRPRALASAYLLFTLRSPFSRGARISPT